MVGRDPKVDRDPQVNRDPQVGRGTRISNIRLYESSKIDTLEVGRDQIKFEN
jgi:hypothetical protein